MMRRLLAATATLALLAACDVQSGNVAENAPESAEATENSPAANAAAPLGEPVAREAALKLMHDRHENMESIGDAVKVTGRTLKSDSPDLTLIRSSAAKIAELAPNVPSWFPPGSGPDVGETHAKPEIWQKPEDFAAKARDMNAAAQAFHAAAQAGDMAAINERFAALGKTCKACHDVYREKDD
jgi:cytochrome c556